MTFDDIYGTRQGANKMLRRMVELGEAEVIGQVSFKGAGGTCLVYAAADGPSWKRNQLKHDVIAHRVIVKLRLPFLNGEDVDQALLPDFVLLTKKKAKQRRVNGEVDTGASPYKRIEEERLPKYDGCPDPVLWVSCGLWSTGDTTRRDAIAKRAKGRPNHWVVTLADILEHKLAVKVVNCDGVTKTLGRLFTDPVLPSTVPDTAEPQENKGTADADKPKTGAG